MGNTKFGFVGKLKELAFLDSYVTIENNKSVTVESCRQICECSEVMARVMTKDYTVEIWGQGLELSNFTEDCVEVKGKIDSVKLISRSFMDRNKN